MVGAIPHQKNCTLSYMLEAENYEVALGDHILILIPHFIVNANNLPDNVDARHHVVFKWFIEAVVPLGDSTYLSTATVFHMMDKWTRESTQHGQPQSHT